MLYSRWENQLGVHILIRIRKSSNPRMQWFEEHWFIFPSGYVMMYYYTVSDGYHHTTGLKRI